MISTDVALFTIGHYSFNHVTEFRTEIIYYSMIECEKGEHVVVMHYRRWKTVQNSLNSTLCGRD